MSRRRGKARAVKPVGPAMQSQSSSSRSTQSSRPSSVTFTSSFYRADMDSEDDSDSSDSDGAEELPDLVDDDDDFDYNYVNNTLPTTYSELYSNSLEDLDYKYPVEETIPEQDNELTLDQLEEVNDIRMNDNRPSLDTSTSQANSSENIQYDDDGQPYEEIVYNCPSPSLPRTDPFYTPPSGYARFSIALGATESTTYDISLLRDFKRIPRKKIWNFGHYFFTEGEGVLGPFGLAYYTPELKNNFFAYNWAPIAGFDIEFNDKLNSYVMPITKEFTAVFKFSRIDYRLFLCDIPLPIFSLEPGDDILCTSHIGTSKGSIKECDDAGEMEAPVILSRHNDPPPPSVLQPSPEITFSTANFRSFENKESDNINGSGQSRLVYENDEAVREHFLFIRPSPSLPRTDAFYTPPSGYARFSIALAATGSTTYDISLLRDFRKIPKERIGNDAGVLVAEGIGILGPFGLAYYTPDAKTNFLAFKWAPIADFDVTFDDTLESYIMPITKDFTAVFKHSRIDYKLYLCDIPRWMFSLEPGDNSLCKSRSENNKGILKEDDQVNEKEAPHNERKESVAGSFSPADALKAADSQADLNSDDESDGSEGLPDLVDDDDDDYNDEALDVPSPSSPLPSKHSGPSSHVHGPSLESSSSTAEELQQ